MFTTGGQFRQAFGAFGTGEGQFHHPEDVSWDDTNDALTVADWGNDRVLVLDRNFHPQIVVDGAAHGLAAPLAAVVGSDGIDLHVFVSAADRLAKIRLPYSSPADVWHEMRARLASGDVEGAPAHFTPRSRKKYQEAFAYFRHQLPGLAASLAGVEPVYVRGKTAVYQLERVDQVHGQAITVPYYVHFDRDQNGVWQIRSF